MIPYGRQDISEKDIEAVVDVLRSDFITQGPAVPAFEKSIAAYCGSKYAIAVNSATSALHIACLALDVGPGDIVWTSPNSFVASANCARYCGAAVDFVDIDPDTFNLCPRKLASRLAEARDNGKLPKVVIPVHFAGQSCDMKAIGALAREYGFSIIEDAAHAIGGAYEGRPIGACQYSDITIFSFHPVKIITTAEGGMAVTQNKTLASRMEKLRSHGITRDQNELIDPGAGAWYYEQQILGYNYRMTDIQAALGLSQMNHLDEFVAARRRLASVYSSAFLGTEVRPQRLIDAAESAFHLFVIRIPREKHLDTFNTLRAQGIGANLHYIPIYHQPYYQGLGFKNGHCPEAESYYAEAISLPLFPKLTEAEQSRVISVVKASIGL